jgi:hypothetical protein
MALYNCREKLNLFLKDRPDLRDELRELWIRCTNLRI